LTNVGRQRQALLTSALATNHQLTGPPIDVIKRQTSHLAAA